MCLPKNSGQNRQNWFHEMFSLGKCLCLVSIANLGSFSTVKNLVKIYNRLQRPNLRIRRQELERKDIGIFPTKYRISPKNVLYDISLTDTRSPLLTCQTRPILD